MKSSEVVRPRIGVPVRLSSSDTPDSRVGEANRLFTCIVDLLREAGAQPVLLTPVSADSAGRLAVEMQTLDGVVLPGGGDINPRLYGQDPDGSLYDVNPEQDHLDMDVARATIDAGLPLLGICRGHQLLNVLYGGTLIQDMAPSAVNHSSLDPDDPEAGEWAWHDVVLTPGSKTAGLYGSPDGSTVKIASGHHQAVSRVGEGLLVTAIADDRTVEALEDPSRWVVSVQWHPEAAQLSDAGRLLPFKEFVDVCRNPTHGPSAGVQ